MRATELLRLSALMGAFALVGVAGAQPPEPKQVPDLKPDPVRGGIVRPAPLSVDDIVARIMSFDKNKDGKVTKDELPERMQYLIERGDTNKDGALDKDEIKKLVTTLPPPPGGFGAGGVTVAGPGPGGPGGPNIGFGFGGQIAGGGFVGPGPGPGPGVGVIEGVVDDLKLSGKKKEQAMAAAKAHHENVRKLMDQARAQLIQKMKEILSEEELKDFEAALDRPRAVTVERQFFLDGPRPPAPGGPVPGGPVPVGAPPGDVEKKIEKLQKELDDLRRQLRR